MPRGSGRRPLPTAVKKLRGNAGKRKLNDAEPRAPAGIPQMPKMSREAAQEWKRIVPELLRLGVLTVVDGKALAGYCHSYARWRQAEAAVAKYGLIIREPILHAGELTGFVRIKRNPAAGESREAMKTMKSFLVEFGLTPASRSRVKAEKPPEEDPFEKYMNHGAQSSSAKPN